MEIGQQNFMNISTGQVSTLRNSPVGAEEEKRKAKLEGEPCKKEKRKRVEGERYSPSCEANHNIIRNKKVTYLGIKF